MTEQRPSWAVYLILEPLMHRAIYVGISINPRARAGQHFSDRSSAVFETAQHYHRLGLDMILVAIAYFASRAEALSLENSLIAYLPGLLNRTEGVGVERQAIPTGNDNGKPGMHLVIGAAEPDKSLFDRNAYQRDYMRNRRAKAKLSATSINQREL